MDQKINLTDYLNLSPPRDIKYFAEYDLSTGALLKVGPESAFQGVHYKLEIDKDIAQGMIQGTIVVGTYHIDLLKNELVSSKAENAIKIDDLIHRITDDHWATYDYPDIFLTYYKKNNSIKLEMSERFSGTKKIPKKFHPVRRKQIHWNGDTTMIFHVTAYNDPTIMYESFTIALDDLFQKSKTVVLKNKIDDDFSVFTRRIFENYGLTKK